MSRTPFNIALTGLTLTAALCVRPAWAAGVAAGTVIENVATATYSSGAGTASIQSNRVSLRVDELLDVAVATLSTAPQPLSGGTAVLSYAVTNSGNGSEAYTLAVDPAVAGNPFTATIQAIVADSNGNGTYDAGVDAVLATGASTPALAADAALRVFVLVGLPAGAADAAISQVRLTATAETGSGTPGTTFAGAGDGGVDAVVGASTARSATLAAVIARLGAVGLTKSAVIADPFGGSRPVPGALVTYSLVTRISGSGSAEGVTVSDGIPAGTTYQAGTLKLDGAALSDAADADAGTAAASGVAVALGTLAAGSPDRTISFTVKIN
ncbi:DUF11 domain-containing protein [Novosphingobium piscinae]|uniref:DUF11 domain-containing protein n=1 Tax=Novosphingobium piscinae TaxID=1507448 RepID=A0A7X1G028_9SPHN|nr:DUF11 domain-containing protein [Novosphingobium piscinae]MBC2670175.1 DUF11 domain-containing protein [Novosphingobium piscinae]